MRNIGFFGKWKFWRSFGQKSKLLVNDWNLAKIFDRTFNFWPTFRFLTSFCTKISILTQISIFEIFFLIYAQNFDFLIKKFACLGQTVWRLSYLPNWFSKNIFMIKIFYLIYVGFCRIVYSPPALNNSSFFQKPRFKTTNRIKNGTTLTTKKPFTRWFD